MLATTPYRMLDENFVEKVSHKGLAGLVVRSRVWIQKPPMPPKYSVYSTSLSAELTRGQKDDDSCLQEGVVMY